MSASVSYAALHPAVAHLSNEQIGEIHARYMSGVSVRSLLAEYRIETERKQLSVLLPLKTLNDQPCPVCRVPMQQKWPTRSSGPTPVFCKPCGHRQTRHCACLYCIGQRLRRENRQWADKRLPYLQLSVRHKILLAALLLTHKDEITVGRDTHETGSFTPGPSMTRTFILELWDAGVIVLTRAPAWVISNHRAEWVYMPEQYGWSNNVSMESGEEAAWPAFELFSWLLTDLDLNLQATDEPVLVSLIMALAEESAYAYIESQMIREGLGMSCEVATRKVVRTMIETLSLADICAVGWQAAKNCSRCYVNNVAEHRRHAANMLPGAMSRIAQARLLKPDAWKVKRTSLEVSRIERVLHQVLRGEPDDFFNWPPGLYCMEVVRPRLNIHP